ncbi:MAG: hypothetical protein LBE03_02305 [Candidatus Nomurabacteria bacterium]|nr:hypothetical protein [Candidatus Nomurabacteria bacterium]
MPINKKLNEKIEVMALFTYGLNPCEPLKFKRAKGLEIKIESVLKTQIKFQGINATHIFDVTDGENEYRLKFDSQSLNWALVG